MYPYSPPSYGYFYRYGFHLVGLFWFWYLAAYAFVAYCLMVISQKTKTPHPWMAWIPVLNVFQLIKVAGKSFWWALLLLVPVVNIFVAVYLWMEIARRRGFDGWLGILMIIPFVNVFLLGYLAFAEPKKK